MLVLGWMSGGWVVEKMDDGVDIVDVVVVVAAGGIGVV